MGRNTSRKGEGKDLLCSLSQKGLELVEWCMGATITINSGKR